MPVMGSDLSIIACVSVVLERGNGAYRIEHSIVSYRIVYRLHLVTPRSEGRGGTGPDTLYCDLANEVQRSNT